MRRIKVQILGNSYYVNTNDGEERVRSMETDISDCLAEIAQQKPGISGLDALALAALNFADEAASCREATDRMREQLAGYLDEASRCKSELSEAYIQTDRLNLAVTELQEKLARITKQRDDAVSLVASLRDESFRDATQIYLGGDSEREEYEETRL